MKNFKELSLRKNFSWNLIGNIVYTLCQWGKLVVLAKLTNPEIVGRFALGLSITAPIILLCDLRLRTVQATDAKGECLFGHYLGLRLVTTALALLVISGIAFSGAFSLEAGLVIFAVGFSKAAESLSDIFYGYMQRNERMDSIAKSRMIKGPLTLLVLGGVVYITEDIFWAVLGLALSLVLILVVYDMPNAALILKWKIKNSGKSDIHQNNLLPKFDWQPLVRLAWLAFPLGVVAGLVSLKPNIPRYFIEFYWGERELGIFAALSYLIVAGNTVIGAMGQAATPRLANYYASGEVAKFRWLLLRLSFMGLAIGLAGVAISLTMGRSLLILLYGSEYAVHTDVLTWIMVSGALAFVASFLGYGITASRKFRIQIPLFLVVAGITTMTCWALMPAYGLIGGALALACGSIAQVLGSLIIVVNSIKTMHSICDSNIDPQAQIS